MKRIGIGLSDFKELIEEDFYYFDKTKFIDEIVKDGAKVKLFARPRRFGKTLNMSMLKYFFDIKEGQENRKLFKDLYIEKTESFREQGQYPVIFLSLKDLKATTWEEMERKIIIILSDFFSEYEYLLNELTGISFENLKNIIYRKADIDELTTTLKFLTKILYEKYNKKVMVLIDEYEENLQEILLTSVSYNDTKKGNEAFYHGLIMGMGLYLEGEYITKSNIESGLGRYDFSVEPKNKNKRAFIMEFKSTDSEEKLEEVSKEALEQIEAKKYDISLKQNGVKAITYIGIAFCGKKIKISYK